MVISNLVTVRRAEAADVPAVASLFVAYRAFYQLAPAPEAATAYLAERLQHKQSVILVAERAGRVCGFSQLYPTWCSLSLAHYYILYDLFVVQAARRLGAGRALLVAAADVAKQQGADRLELATAVDNHSAQSLYHSLGWQLDETYLHFNLPLR